MATWTVKPVNTEHGLRWVVEDETGSRQHYGHLYADEAQANLWADILNAFHRGWDAERNARGAMP